jgi:hypothetical protein
MTGPAVYRLRSSSSLQMTLASPGSNWCEFSACVIGTLLRELLTEMASESHLNFVSQSAQSLRSPSPKISIFPLKFHAPELKDSEDFNVIVLDLRYPCFWSFFFNGESPNHRKDELQVERITGVYLGRENTGFSQILIANRRFCETLNHTRKFLMENSL